MGDALVKGTALLGNARAARRRIAAAALFFCAAASIATYIYLVFSGAAFTDIESHWRICTYARLGIDPFPLIGGEAKLDGVGAITAGFSTAPWSLFLGTFFYGGFLPYGAAKVYICILHGAALLFVPALIAKCYPMYFKEDGIKYLVLTVLGHFSFCYSLLFGNSGGVLALLLLASIALAESGSAKASYYENEEAPAYSKRVSEDVAGIFLAFAMTKPQMALPVCLIFLLRKRIRTLVVGGIVTVFSWFVASMMTGTGMISLLREMMQYGTAVPHQYQGIFSVFRAVGLPQGMVAAGSAAVGIGFTLAFWLYMRKRETTPAEGCLAYVPALAASVVWTFKNGTDFLVLSAAAYFCFVLFTEKAKGRGAAIASLLCMLYLELGRDAASFAVKLTESAEWTRDLWKSIDGLLVLVCTAAAVLMWYSLKEKAAAGKG